MAGRKGRMSTERRAVWALRFIVAIMGITNVTNAIIAYIAASYQQVDPTLVTSILTIPALVGTFVSFVSGPLALKVNKKYLIIGAAMCDMVYYATFFIVGSNGPFEALLIAAIFPGFSRGAIMPLANASIGEFVKDEEKRGSAVAVNAALVNICFAVGMLVFSSLASRNGGVNWNEAYIVGLVPLVSIVVFGLLMPKYPDEEENPQAAGATMSAVESEKAEEPASERKGSILKGIPALVALIIVVGIVYTISFNVFSQQYSRYIISEFALGTSVEAGMASAVLTVCSFVTGMTYKYWNRFLKNWTSTVAFAIVASGLFLMAFVHGPIAVVFASAALIGIGNSLFFPYLMSQIMVVTNPKVLPVAMSLYQGCVNLSMFAALYVTVFFGGLIGPSVANIFLVGGIGVLIAMTASLLLFSLKKQKDPQKA